MQTRKEILADSVYNLSETLSFQKVQTHRMFKAMVKTLKWLNTMAIKKYINPLMFQNTPLQVEESVLDDIDDICVYEVPQKADLNNCKQKRP